MLRRLLWVFVILQLLGVMWDLPSGFSWDNDGIAPRDLFGGLANNLTPGKAHRYPLFHYAIIAVLSLPALLVGAVMGLLSDGPFVHSILSVPVMTAVTLVARLVSVAMAVGTVVVVARLSRRLFGREAGRWTALSLVCCVCFAWYGRASNLDGPYVFWVALATYFLLDIQEFGTRRDWVRFALALACGVATKDQAYAPFVLLGPLYALILPLAPSATRLERVRHSGVGLGVGALAYGVASGALLNPTGFVARLSLLTGTNSQDWRLYAKGLAGLRVNIADVWQHQADYLWSWGVVGAGWLGLGIALVRSDRVRGLLPGLGAISSILAFTLVVGRSEERFVLMFAVLFTPYIGLALATMVQWAQVLPRGGELVAVLALLLCVHSGRRVVALTLTQWGDSRRTVESFLDSLPADTTVETYGLTVYQLRFAVRDGGYRPSRVGPKEPKRRNPVLGAKEVQGRYLEIADRRPDVVVIPLAFANRYLREAPADGARRVQNVDPGNQDAQRFFRAAATGTLPGYSVPVEVDVAFPDWAATLGMAPERIHSSTGVVTLVLVRRDAGIDLSPLGGS